MTNENADFETWHEFLMSYAQKNGGRYQLLQELTLRAEQAEYQLKTLRDIPGVIKAAMNSSKNASMADIIYPQKGHGPMGKAYHGD